MRTRLLLASLPLVAMFAVAATAQSAPTRISAEAKAIHESAIVVDTHADTPQRFLDEGFDMATVTPVSEGHIDLSKVKAGNLGAEFFSIWVEPGTNQGHFARKTLQLIDSVYEQVQKHPNDMVLARSVADIRAARTGPHKKLAALMGIEGGHSIENDVRLLRDYYRLGVRYMTLAWSNTNEFADSSGDIRDDNVKHHDGLSPYGKDVVREMNRLGMMVDISHVSDKTFYDTIAVTKAPVIASHSCARALSNHPRNMTDDMLRAVAKNGGVVQVNFFSVFVDDNFRKAYQAQAPEEKKAEDAYLAKLKAEGKEITYLSALPLEKEWAAKIPRPPFKSLIEQIDHVAKVAGIDHVGLGSDFDGVTTLPEGIDSAADLPKITQGLLDRGYNREQIHKILGGNLLRVFSEVERVSRESK